MISLVADISDMARHWRNCPEINRWCRQYKPISEKEQADWLEKIHRDPTIQMFGIWDRDRADEVGVCGLTSIDLVNRNAEFSLYIAPAFQGGGYGKKALQKLCDFGFNNLGLRRIWGEVFEKNPALEMFMSIGFSKEGLLRNSYYREGRWINSTIIGLLSEERKWTHGV
jgi:RimJ/RimL family protein N-acetyltransferase